MGNDKPTSDRSADGDADSDERRYDEDDILRSFDIDADMAGIVLPDGEGVELRVKENMTVPKTRSAPSRMRTSLYWYRTGAHQPEYDGIDLCPAKVITRLMTELQNMERSYRSE